MRCNSILIVEDDDAMRESLLELLRTEGYEPQTANSGETAIELLKTMTKPCLILLDIAMPKMTGLAFIEKIRKMGLDGISHVIIMTALNKFVSKDYQVIQKPFDLEVLMSAVNEFANNAKLAFLPIL